MRSVELFTGCGGLSLGLARAGFEHELLVEWNEDAVATVVHNRNRGVAHVANWPIVRGDVREIDWSVYGGATLVAGGPPCQPFSIGGKHNGNHDDRDMWPQAAAVREARPEAFLFENVRGLLRPKFAGYLEAIVNRLKAPDPRSTLRYNVRILSLNAADFGAPQKRHRVVIAGVRSDLGCEFAEIHSTHSRDRLLWDQWITGDYWREHGLDRDPHSFATTEGAAIKRLRAAGAEPSGKRWVTIRDALRGLGDPDGRNNHLFQPGARTRKGTPAVLWISPQRRSKLAITGCPEART